MEKKLKDRASSRKKKAARILAQDVDFYATIIERANELPPNSALDISNKLR